MDLSNRLVDTLYNYWLWWVSSWGRPCLLDSEHLVVSLAGLVDTLYNYWLWWVSSWGRPCLLDSEHLVVSLAGLVDTLYNYWLWWVSSWGRLCLIDSEHLVVSLAGLVDTLYNYWLWWVSSWGRPCLLDSEHLVVSLAGLVDTLYNYWLWWVSSWGRSCLLCHWLDQFLTLAFNTWILSKFLMFHWIFLVFISLILVGVQLCLCTIVTLSKNVFACFLESTWVKIVLFYLWKGVSPGTHSLSVNNFFMW